MTTHGSRSLHPIMFLLNLTCDWHLFHYANTFTSHYVPIKSASSRRYFYVTRTFTSHYVPIKSQFNDCKILALASLHPIMFLLNLEWIAELNSFDISLHPIMFLLNRKFSEIMNNTRWLYIPLCSY